MGIKERKEKEKQDLKALILAAANEIFVREGLEAVSIRAIADKIEYSPATIYLYYRDKRELLFDIHELGFQVFFGQLRAAVAPAQDPLEALSMMGHAYIDFAIAHPNYYDLMFISEGVLPENIDGHEVWDNGYQSLNFLRDTLRQCIAAGLVDDHELEGLTLSVWAHVHGLASLYLKGRLDDSMKNIPNVQQLMHEAVDIKVKAFRKH